MTHLHMQLYKRMGPGLKVPEFPFNFNLNQLLKPVRLGSREASRVTFGLNNKPPVRSVRKGKPPAFRQSER